MLLDIEALVQEDNSTFNAGLERMFEYAENANFSAGDRQIDTAAAAAVAQKRLRQALDFAAGEGAWDRMFAVFFCMCGAVLVLVVSGKCCGCFTQGNGRTGGLGKMMIGFLKFVTSALFIPMYNHLIQALDCTYYERFNSTSGEWETGLGWDAMPTIQGSVEYECYEGRHLAVMLAAMLAICFFQWPVTYFLCTLPDSPPDPIRDVIIDEFVVHKKLAGRLKKVRNYETGFEWRLGEVPDRRKIDALKRSELRKQARKFLPQSVLDAIDDDETIDYREEVTKRLLGESMDVPKLAYTAGCFSTLAEMYGTPSTSPPGGQGRTGLLRDWAAGSRPCVVYKENSPAWKLREELLLPKLELRRVVIKMGMDKQALHTLDARVAGCCHAGDDQQFDGIASVKRRPRENAIIFALDTYLVTIAAMYSGAGLDVKSTRIKLVGLATGHFMQCIFYCNPLIFLSGCKCTPYDDKTGVQSRGSLMKMGYPYNYEPLNFVRAAGASIRLCCVCVCDCAHSSLVVWRLQSATHEHSFVSETDCDVRMSTAGSSICGLFALFQMVAMEASLTPGTCDGTFLRPSAGCDLEDDGCATTSHNCSREFEERVNDQGMDAKDNSTCPVGCDFVDDTITPEAAMAMFLGESTALSPLPLSFSYISEKSLCGAATAAVVLVVYSLWMLVRCCVFSKHRREALREEMREEMAKKRGGSLSRKNVASM